ncbi:uncharacterized protein DFE_2844 [Desulfovibrio ferrophilus]|uniref:Uncharacterized protein n=1 Tax=Desulfovibrio ferrophilus TaxID=241368 RepID=A0A2Z6B2B0_9BACT|nr:uncharacterized protein DFE_2844 [Desulfovibrio ferrophilus]
MDDSVGTGTCNLGEIMVKNVTGDEVNARGPLLRNRFSTRPEFADLRQVFGAAYAQVVYNTDADVSVVFEKIVDEIDADEATATCDEDINQSEIPF